MHLDRLATQTMTNAETRFCRARKRNGQYVASQKPTVSRDSLQGRVQELLGSKSGLKTA